MVYVEVLVSDSSFHGSGALTYHSKEVLRSGDIVFVPLQKKEVMGIVVATSTVPPSFNTKEILAAPAIPSLPKHFPELIKWMQSYYPYPLGSITAQFLPRELPKKSVDPFGPLPSLPIALPPLTAEQQAAVSSINSSGLHILHGETGTGKTRVYIELALRAMQQNRSAIILTPEISLTSQLADNLRIVFGERVIVLHSQLTDAVRRRLWLATLRETDPLIIVGPRSALFSPLHDVGLVVLDESHEPAYKQDKSPYYQTAHVAGKLAALCDAVLVLGSATPSVTDYYFAQQRNRPILRMTQIAKSSGSKLPSVEVIDLKNRVKFTKKSHLSDSLIEAVRATLDNKEQALLFLNRRGTARVILCDNCGWQALCPRCDLPLIYHHDSHQLRCHSCNYTTTPPLECPICNNTSVIFTSIGTKAIFDEVTSLFPEAIVSRYDTDNTKEQRIEQHYPALHRGEIDILVGTQTIAKGLDLPNLSLVGVIAADTSLYIPDFSAQERTYQLLRQVVGRVGRGHRAGKVIIQTYHPDSAILRSVVKKDWDTFYINELQERQQFLFPPFCYLLKLWCRRATQKSAQQAATNLAKKLNLAQLRIVVEGPAPAFQEKFNDQYQWQLIVKSKNRQELLKVVHILPGNWSYDIDPLNLL